MRVRQVPPHVLRRLRPYRPRGLPRAAIVGGAGDAGAAPRAPHTMTNREPKRNGRRRRPASERPSPAHMHQAGRSMCEGRARSRCRCGPRASTLGAHAHGPTGQCASEVAARGRVGGARGWGRWEQAPLGRARSYRTHARTHACKSHRWRASMGVDAVGSSCAGKSTVVSDAARSPSELQSSVGDASCDDTAHTHSCARTCE